MNGIDISNYQTGINLAAVPCDFVIILVTEGQRVVNTDWRRQCEQALSLGKAVMLYHYIEGGNASGEADTFWNTTREYSGRVCYAVDWEAGSNRAWGIESYLETLVKRLKANSGRTVVLYAPSGAYPWGVAARQGCPTWVAQYADTEPTGYQDHPWNEWAYQADIRQYSGTGRLPGWGGDLDLDKSYATKQQWSEWAGNEDDMPLTQDDINKVAAAVWMQKLPNNAVARDCIAPAVNNAFWVRDHGMPDLQNQIVALQKSNDTMNTSIVALKAALDVLAKSVGANPQDLAKVVADAVRDKLSKTIITMDAKEQQ